MSKLIKYLGEDWVQLLEGVFNKHWELIKSKIKKEKRVITPSLNKVFRCFLECPLKELHTIILVDGPMTSLIANKPVADGLALSVNSSITEGLPFEAMLLNEATECKQDLTYVANQGVLLLNTSLTSGGNIKDSHKEIWEDFIIDTLNTTLASKVGGLNLVVIGENAHDISTKLNKSNHNVYYSKYFCKETWEKEFVHKINNELIRQSKTPIYW